MGETNTTKTTKKRITSISDFWNVLEGKHVFPSGTSKDEWTLYSRYHEEPIKARIGDTLVFSGPKLIKIIREK